MKLSASRRFAVGASLVASVLAIAPATSADEVLLAEPDVQIAIVGEAVFQAEEQAAKPKDKPEGGEKPAEEVEVEPTPTPVVPLGPRFIRLHLQDGSVISGDLSISDVTMTTTFGKLIIPIEKIQSFSPGLSSNPKLNEEIATLINNLGADDYKAREQAHRDLVARGLRIRQQLVARAGDENAEIKRHISDILKEFEQLEEEREDEDQQVANETALIAQDTIVTSEFTVIGKISPVEFSIDSKYGPLKIALSDIAKAEREVVAGKQTLRKNLDIQGTNLAARNFKSTGIKVRAGDRLNIRADGTITLSPWGNNAQSSPDGMPNYGWYIPNQIPTGSLCGKIGDKGTPFKVGRNYSTVVKQSGILHLALAMPNEYSGEGYQFPGAFKVKVKVDPK